MQQPEITQPIFQGILLEYCLISGRPNCPIFQSVQRIYNISGCGSACLIIQVVLFFKHSISLLSAPAIFKHSKSLECTCYFRTSCLECTVSGRPACVGTISGRPVCVCVVYLWGLFSFAEQLVFSIYDSFCCKRMWHM